MVVVVLIVVVIIVGHKNLTLKFVQNWVNNKWYIVVVVFIVSALKLGPIKVIDSWDLLLLFIVVECVVVFVSFVVVSVVIVLLFQV